MALFDAHLHLQDPRLDEIRNDYFGGLKKNGIREVIVNGTSERDWATVSALASENKAIRPAFGLHPWFIKEKSENWLDSLKDYLLSHPDSLIGEIGLDKWIRNPEFEQQKVLLKTQLELSLQLNKAPAIHCLKAWGTLLDILKSYPLKNFLLHSYSGPEDMIKPFLDAGAYFSFSGYFARPDKLSKLNAWRKIPIDRLLVETDAPDMLPPEELQVLKQTDAEGNFINNPTNISAIYQWLADFYGMETSCFEKQIESNYYSLFGEKGL